MTASSNIATLEETLVNNNPLLSCKINSLLEQLQIHHYRTYHHSIRVGLILLDFGKYVGVTEEKLEQMYYSGVLHDIGKLTIPADVLNKSGKLSSEEWKTIQGHVSVGVDLLKECNLPEFMMEGIAGHHENINGSGYPRQLKEPHISRLAKVIRVVDSYDAMTEPRSYSRQLTREEALTELEKNKDVLFDHAIVETFCRMAREGNSILST